MPGLVPYLDVWVCTVLDRCAALKVESGLGVLEIDANHVIKGLWNLNEM